jgi:DNA-binding transcriptional regulator YdaS (Cro superfamily)
LGNKKAFIKRNVLAVYLQNNGGNTMQLKEWLKKHRIKVTQMAEIIGISYLTLYRHLKGIQGITTNTAIAIERATNGAVNRLELMFPNDFYIDEVETDEGKIDVIRCNDVYLDKSIKKHLIRKKSRRELQAEKRKEKKEGKPTQKEPKQEKPQEEKAYWCFTFGEKHKPYHKCYVRIYGTHDEAKAMMFNKFGRQWEAQHKEDAEFREMANKKGFQELKVGGESDYC